MAYSLNKKIITIFFLFIVALFLGLLILLGFIYFSHNQGEPVNNSFRNRILEFSAGKDYSIVSLKIDEKIIETELVFSSEAMYLGLSGRDSLAPNKGMLFVFNDYGHRKFLMRNMNFPLDIVFLKNGEVVKIFSNLAPEGESPKNIYQYGLADMVIELPGNYFKNNNLHEGMTFELVNSGT